MEGVVSNVIKINQFDGRYRLETIIETTTKVVVIEFLFYVAEQL